MSSLNFKSVVAALTCALLATAAVPYRRSVAWLQQNGPAAKALNDQYASLTATSSCGNDGDIACVNGQFATCLGGRYIIDPCPSGWTCAAIPNERSAGTTTTCDTSEDISWRFSQAGVSEFKRSLPPARRESFLEQNGAAAKALNDEYATLTTSSSCSGGVACINGQFASCYEGRYLTWSCAGGRTCAAIPNEWSAGTTTTCDTSEDISWRFSQAGVFES